MCANGSPTGIGVRVEPNSDELLLYMQGGGACSTGDNCWVNPGAQRLNGYDAAAFANDRMANYPLFETTAGTENPFAAMNMVLLPYCTGDGHAGSVSRDLDVKGTPRRTSFVGAQNVQRALQWLAGTFPSLKRVWLVGTSAGGGGATYNYAAIRAALNVPVNTVVDSAPGFLGEVDEEKWAIWGVQPPCATCTSQATTRTYNRSLDSEVRYGLMSFRYDLTTSNGATPEQFDASMTALLAELQADPNTRTFIVDNSATQFTTTQHVITTKNEPVVLRSASLQWLSAMVSGVGWSNVTLPAP